MILRRILFLILGVLLFVSVTYADQVTLQITGPNVLGVNDGHYYVSPYTGLLNGAFILLYCDDAQHSANSNPLTYNRNSILNPNLSQLQFGAMAGATTLYQQAGWLVAQYIQTAPSGWVDIQQALWHLFTPSYTCTVGCQNWLSLAASNYQNTQAYASLQVLTDVNKQYQEYIVITPEPGTLATLGLGLIGLATKLRRVRL